MRCGCSTAPGFVAATSGFGSSGIEHVKEITMALSNQLAQLTARAKEAEDRLAASREQARDRLEQEVDRARETTQTRTEKLHGEIAAAGDRATEWADNLRRSWNQHVEQVRTRMKADKSRMDAKMAEADAKDAEDYAAFAIDFAYTAIEEAEYACLYAVLARQSADDAARTTPR
jgi:hypothetical protein